MPDIVILTARFGNGHYSAAANIAEALRLERPDLSVDGTIELERLADILYVGRPAYGQEQSVISLFRVEPDGVRLQRDPIDDRDARLPRELNRGVKGIYDAPRRIIQAIAQAAPVKPLCLPVVEM